MIIYDYIWLYMIIYDYIEMVSFEGTQWVSSSIFEISNPCGRLWNPVRRSLLSLRWHEIPISAGEMAINWWMLVVSIYIYI